MTKEAVLNAAHALPFKPFSLRLADGNLLNVPHPDFIHLTAGGGTAIVNREGENFSIIDLALVIAIDFSSPTAKPS